MNPTLKNGNIILMKKYNMQLSNNDIVVIKKDKKIIVKRIVGIPGDNIKINDYVFVNGEKFDEIITENSGYLKNEIHLNDKEYFVLGDNREHSIDSRFEEIGIVLEQEIIGKVILDRGGK